MFTKNQYEGELCNCVCGNQYEGDCLEGFKRIFVFAEINMKGELFRMI